MPPFLCQYFPFLTVNIFTQQQEELDMQESLHKIVTSEQEGDDYSKPITDLKDSILNHIFEFETELETR